MSLRTFFNHIGDVLSIRELTPPVPPAPQPVINITRDVSNVDIFALARTQYGIDGSFTGLVQVNIQHGVVVYAENTYSYAMYTGGFNSHCSIIINIAEGAYITGAGGNGGTEVNTAVQKISTDGSPGGNALWLTVNTTINNRGTIQGGGGGGGAAGGNRRLSSLHLNPYYLICPGSGGAGRNPGQCGTSTSSETNGSWPGPGTLNAGGHTISFHWDNQYGGAGGAPGQPGGASPKGNPVRNGGAGGKAIVTNGRPFKVNNIGNGRVLGAIV